jgi:hypothetical protein
MAGPSTGSRSNVLDRPVRSVDDREGDEERGVRTDIEPRSSSRKYEDLPFLLIALASGATLLYLGRSLTFWEDEWRSIAFDGGPVDYLRPVNQHWSTFPLLLYRATFRVVGLHSYLPYLAQVIVLHLCAVAGAYALMRNRAGPVVATMVAIPLLFLGTGGENLFWAFQTGFVGSVMFGVWALFFIERPSRRAPLIASLLLVASLTASGMGLFFLAVAAARTIFDPSIRLRAVAVLPPLAAYLVWFALVGRDPLGEGRLFIGASTARFAVRGIVYATERASGVDHLPDGYLWGILLFIGLSVLTGYRFASGRPAALAAGCLLGVTTLYSVIALVRAQADPGYDHAISSRYVYVAAFLLALAVVDLLPERGGWSAPWTRQGVVVVAALSLALGCVIAANAYALLTKRSEFRETADYTRAFIELAVTRGNEPWVDRDSPRGWMPSVTELQQTIARHGSPLRDELFPGVFEPPGADAREAALLGLISGGFRVEEPRRLAVSTTSKCVRADASAAGASLTLTVRGGARLRATSSTPVTGAFQLAHKGGPPSRQIYADLTPGGPKDVVIPDVGDGRNWLVGMNVPVSSGEVILCVLHEEGRTTG